jgi:2,3-bisphosphoglycerate-independent phosphoglycerate mutase
MEAIDACLGNIAAAVGKQGGYLMVTADHGNIEEMLNPDTGEVDTEHSDNPVPFFLLGPPGKKIRLRTDGRISDIAPTILALLGRPQPVSMTGKSLFAR